jgi:DUF971 family protein
MSCKTGLSDSLPVSSDAAAASEVGAAAAASGPAAPVTWPSEIKLDKKNRLLALVWDGAPAVLSHKALRRSCRCSVCESQRRKLDDVIPVADDIELMDIEVLGSTGLRLYFSDRHDRGIFPWTYLRQMAFGATDPGFTDALKKGWHDE